MSEHSFSLENKIILITGASSGIGRASAVACAKMGASLVLTGRNLQRLNETLAMLDSDGHSIIVADLTNSEELTQLVQNTPQLNGVVFAAGIAELVPFKMISPEHINRVMGVNFLVPIQLTQALLRSKKISASASLVYLTAVAEHICPLGSSIYSASKSALTAVVKTLGLELARNKIRANCVSPGYVKTEMLEKLPCVEQYFSLVPLGIILAEDVANGVVYLLSSASRWATRTTLVIDGGLTIPVR
jgi:NAD(P)-dependent dehydrogenase (short-subunit alcohol dehydrogenase family)